MCNLFKMEYAVVAIPILNNTNPNNTMRWTTQSLLDTDFGDKDEDNLDKIECYISEKLVNKDIDVLA